MKEIILTQGLSAIVDDEDFERLNAFKWYAKWNGHNWYVKRNVRENNKRVKTATMHREILNAIGIMQVDHVNGNPLDNRKENLRLCTNQQNQFNKKQAQNNNKLGIKGVCWHKRDRKFQAQIKVDGKGIYLGSFNVLGDADSAYRIAEEKYFGNFARNHV